MLKNFRLNYFAEAGTLVNATTAYVNAYTGDTTPFAGNDTLSPGMKTFYDTQLLQNARAQLYYAQFGQKQPLPANNGRVVEWRKFNTLPNAQKLQEAVIPTGRKMGQTVITGAIEQYGDYVAVSDIASLHHCDKIAMAATEELSEAAAKTQDILIRNELMTGANVIYCDAVNTNSDYAYVRTPNARWLLTSGATEACLLTPDMVSQTATWLTKLNVPKINGKYVGVIHPSLAYDLRKAPDWVEAHKYASPEEIYNGEIGELHGIRFVATTQAPVLTGGDLGTNRWLTVAAVASATAGTAIASPGAGETTAYRVTIDETPSVDVLGREIIIEDTTPGTIHCHATIKGVDVTNKYLYIDESYGSAADGDYILPGEGGKETKGGGQVAVYASMFFGANSYGMIDPEGGSMRMIIKPASQIGGPLEQFNTIGYKFEQGSKILYQDRIVRVESVSKYSGVDASNY